MGYIPQIDSLRGFAIIIVVLHHFSASIAAGGHFIVDIFFVISGFVLTLSLTENKKSLPDFFLGRMKRVYPALLFCLLLGSLAACFFCYQFIAEQSAFTAAKSAMASSNYFLIHQAVDYFASASSLNLFTHTWSISIELQFYAFLLIFCLFRHLIWIRWFVLCSVVASLIFYSMGQDQVYHYYSFEARFWVLGLGMLSYLHKDLLPKMPRGTIASILAIFFGLLFLPAGTQFYTRVPAAFLTSILLIEFSRGAVDLSKITESKILNVIGRASYSIYLWHWPVIALARNTVGLSVRTVPVILVVISFFSWLSFRYFERPLLFKKIKLPTWSQISVGTLSAGVLVWVIFQFPNLGLFQGRPQPQLSLKNDPEWVYEKCAGNRNNVIAEEASKNFSECYLRATNPKSTWYTYGDSYNLQLVPLYKKLGIERSIDVFAYGVNGCHMLPLELQTERGEKRCHATWLKFREYLRGKLKAGDRVILSFSNTHFYLLEYLEDNTDPKRLFELLKAELANLNDEVKKSGAVLIWVGSIPVLKTDPRLCYQPWGHWREDCGKEMLDQEGTQARVEMEGRIKVYLKEQGIGFVDLYSPLLDKYHEQDMYWNWNHLSGTGVLKLKVNF